MTRIIGPVYLVKWLPIRHAAITLPPVGIFVKRKHDSERLRRHEQVHWQQYRERSVLGFYVGYLVAWVRAGFSYQNHPWEIEARKLSTE